MKSSPVALASYASLNMSTHQNHLGIFFVKHRMQGPTPEFLIQ